MMQHKVEDYYDLPADLLPAANFAARPSNEISDNSFVEGLWTFMISSSSSSDSEETPTPTNSDPATLTELPANGLNSPRTTASSPKRNGLWKGLTDVTTLIERPRLRKKVSTAPPGTFSLQTFTPHLPRRAISAKRNSSRIDRSRQPRGTSADALTNAPEKNILTYARSDWFKNPFEAEPHTTVPSTSKADQSQDADLSHTIWVQPPPSFSEKARVRRTLRAKKLRNLSTERNTVGLTSAPLSVMITPSEMYGTKTEQRDHGGQMELRLQANRSLQVPTSHQLSSPLHLVKRDHPLRSNNNTYCTQQGTRLRLYRPGQIRLEGSSSWNRRDSVATLHPFDDTIEAKGRDFADDANLDAIVSYFADMGIVEEASVMCQDSYWLRRSVGLRRPRSVSSLEEAVLISPRGENNTYTPRGSRFSFSSGSSGGSKPLSWGPIRQRIRLKRLLSPALPGSVFHRIPAIPDASKDGMPLA